MTTGFRVEPSTEFPGWLTWDLIDDTRFNACAIGKLIARLEDAPGGGRRARLRMFPERQHSNLLDAVHGGATLSLIDIALFTGMRLILDGNAAGSVTLDLSTQFIGAGRLGEPLDAVVEVLRETGRLVFLRGLVEQGDQTIAAFGGTIRKPSR
ncbi:PaaI family thioesterase [Novosphingobium sp. KCTC 2891]|uniref:PaaI family thioesterase n=1 Tax=Novosphingobium sp. KCTC 2891 TaxID=2989730 RepID=UPI00222302DD|nr:PaaI family thioesterase [Novosphingobium sp. KCTC 2891]MCW1381711.1 PaaI family thioesterase [Novosphingobium sp. KCTC 2891]